MKLILSTFAIIALLASSAFASTARVDALQSPFHTVDIVTTFAAPSDMLLLPEAVLIEYGPVGLTSAAKGGFVRNLGEAKLGFFLGLTGEPRTVAGVPAATPLEGIENPFGVSYAAKLASGMTYGVGLTYSNSSKKGTVGGVAVANLDSATQSFMNIAGSLTMDMWTFGVSMNVMDTAKTALTTATEAKYTGGATGIFAHYDTEPMHYRFDYVMGSAKLQDQSADLSNSTASTMTLSFINSMKKDGNEFFYGAGLASGTSKETVSDAKLDTMYLPFHIGVESEAASWLVMRGSITQNVFLGSEKNATNTDTVLHNTKVAAGVGFKFNKSILDMTLTAAGNGIVESDNFGAQAAYTYMF